jgi:hypothetical protein
LEEEYGMGVPDSNMASANVDDENGYKNIFEFIRIFPQKLKKKNTKILLSK